MNVYYDPEKYGLKVIGEVDAEVNPSEIRAVYARQEVADVPRYSDVDVAMVAGVIQLCGDGEVAAVLPGDRAEVLRDMLIDMINERDEDCHD